MEAVGQEPMTKMDKVRAKIAANREAPLLRLVACASEKYLRAFNNQSNWDVWVNGEANALRTITAAAAGDVLDVGANEGQWAAMALTAIGDKRLHCFELVPATFQKLKQRLGGHENIVLNDFGLGSEEKSVDIYFYPESTDRTSAYHMSDGFRKETIRARIVRGDDYLAIQGIERVSFLKIDVEGMEMSVLKGFEMSLCKKIIKGIQFEHGPTHVISRHFLKDFVEFLEEFEYTIFECFPKTLRRLNYDFRSDETFVGQNFIAVLPDIRDACGL
jgi:FkbM family methyltransferase